MHVGCSLEAFQVGGLNELLQRKVAKHTFSYMIISYRVILQKY